MKIQDNFLSSSRECNNGASINWCEVVLSSGTGSGCFVLVCEPGDRTELSEAQYNTRNIDKNYVKHLDVRSHESWGWDDNDTDLYNDIYQWVYYMYPALYYHAASSWMFTILQSMFKNSLHNKS